MSIAETLLSPCFSSALPPAVGLWRCMLGAPFQLLVLEDPADRLAALFGVSRRTVYDWRDLGLASDEPAAAGLKRLAGLDEEPC